MFANLFALPLRDDVRDCSEMFAHAFIAHTTSFHAPTRPLF